jgi:cation diffusion facilitator family transporter
MESPNKESFAIKLSILGAAIMAITGIAGALFGNSISLLFDGLNTLFGIGISLAGLKISKLLKIKYSKRFNFGHYSLEPLFVLTNGLLLLGLAVSLFITSVQTIIAGGRKIELDVVIVYLLFSVVLCSTVALILRHYSKKTKSELVHTDSINWALDALISIVVSLAFLMSVWLNKTKYSFLVPYLDPGITIILILCFVYQPLKLIKSGVMDLLQVSPPSNLNYQIKEKLMVDKDKYGFEDVKILAAKIGRTKVIEVMCFYSEDFKIKNIKDLEILDNKIKAEVESYDENLDVKVTFHAL